MHSIENMILSVLRPGDMVRFVLLPEKNRRVAVEIEGSQAEGTDGSFERRLGVLLEGMRNKGYSFASHPISKGQGATRRTKAARRCDGAPRWVEIRPRTMPFPLYDVREIGFGAKAQFCAGQETIALPDLPMALAPNVFDSLADLLLGTPPIQALEIEFTRSDLEKEDASLLEKAFQIHALAERSNVIGQTELRNPIHAFIALWLSRRSGWAVRARAKVPAEAEAPTATLELVGRDIFSCDCDVTTTGTHDGDGAMGHRDFSMRYPRGWPFPPILPPPEVQDSVAADRLHNSQLPRLPSRGMLVGIAEGQKVHLPLQSRDRHTYVVGATGTGKSTLLLRMIREDMARGEGVILIDPHGDLYSAVKDLVPRARRKAVFALDPLAQDSPPGLNILDLPEGPLRRRHADFLVGELLRLFGEIWDMQNAGGPAFEMYFRNTLLLMCLQDPGRVPDADQSPEANGDDRRKLRVTTGSNTSYEVRIESLLDMIEDKKKRPEPPPDGIHIGHFTRVMVDKEFRKKLLSQCPDAAVREFWTEVADKTTGDYRYENFVPYICCKVNAFTQAGLLARLLCSQDNDFRIGERMDRGEIVLLNLNKGVLGAYESRLLGTILMMQIFAAGLQRSLLPASKRRPVNIYVDEFQDFVSDNVASMLSEARKFGLRLTLANQTLGQLKTNAGKQDLLETVLGNVGNMILFRLGVPDADRLKLFVEPFSRQEMQELPNFHALARILTPEGPIRPLVMRTLPE